MERPLPAEGQDWLDRYKRRIILAIVAILTATIALTMVLIAMTTRDRLLEEGQKHAVELGTVLHSSLEHLMEVRDPGRMQATLVAVGREETALVRAFILDMRGRIAYSSQARDVGRVVDPAADPSCRRCHSGAVVGRHDRTFNLTLDGVRVQRYVHVIENRPACHRCHPSSDAINGKLIIDRSLAPTDTILARTVTIISGIGLACLAVLIPFLWRFLSRGVNTYIEQIRTTSAELSVLYGIVERLSATIELEELKRVVIEILSDALKADQIDMVLPNEYRDLGAIVWTNAGNVMGRKKVEAGSPLHDVIHQWTDGGVKEHAVRDGGREIVMPVAKGGNRLALIIVRSRAGTFHEGMLPLVRGMANHVAVAFENAMLYHIAITDELTGLYSSRHFRQAISKRFALFQQYGEKTALLMIDIDNFKRINDTYGHPAGDGILREIGKCIQSSIRDEDMGFRYGGEEFTVILPAVDAGAGKAVAERMRSLIELFPFRAEGRLLQVTVSIGIAAWPGHSETIRDLIIDADKALYEAKHSGKNKVVVRERVAG
jgi:diguanylate cyclase (GGDEF)-like protein